MIKQTGSRFSRLQKVSNTLPKSLPIIPVIVGFSCLLLLFSGTVYYANSSKRSQNAANTSTTDKQQITANTQQGSELSQASGATGMPSNNGGSNASNSSSSTPQPTTTNSPNKPYTPYNCVKTVLPYKTNYKLATYLGSGSTNVIGGKDGYTSVCTPDSNGLKPNDAHLPAVDRTIYVGDGGGSLSVSPHPRSEPYDVVYARAIPACDELLSITGNDPVAKQWCINNVVAGILHYYGY